MVAANSSIVASYRSKALTKRAIKPFCSFLPHLVLLCCASGFLLQSQAFLLCHIFATRCITKSATIFAQQQKLEAYFQVGYLRTTIFAQLSLRNYLCAAISLDNSLSIAFLVHALTVIFLRFASTSIKCQTVSLNLTVRGFNG